MFDVDFPHGLADYTDLCCVYEAREQYFRVAYDSLKFGAYRYNVFECLEYILDDIVDVPNTFALRVRKTEQSQQQLRQAVIDHWRPFVDALERQDVEAVGRFILDKVEGGVLKEIERTLINERDERLFETRKV